ncbi:hypothetical protein [Clostridium guangxiense]|uniref:hypothetical protein n=1 Tax=Clostridium guangxiense TaxID=1662055 RepID=UPI001E59016C|nr:hypothetical protein [Clostridium guangxiense]MCD2345174.1 hypothetical protein [Clostridium guangxiense]
MEKNNFLPYDIRKKREVLKNKLINLAILILFLADVIFLINLYFEILNYKNKINIKEGTSIIVQNNNTDNKASFKDADVLKLISEKIKNVNYTNISIKDENVEIELLSNENFQRLVSDIENNPKLIIKSLVKSQSSDKYNVVIGVRSI